MNIKTTLSVLGTLALVAVTALLLPKLEALLGLPHIDGISLAAVATYGVTTGKVDVNGVWRKVQAKLQTAAQFMVPEWDMLSELQDFDIDWSSRLIEVPLDLADDSKIASIPEGGYEARPGSPNPVDASLTWILLNGRFTISKTSKMIDQRNRRAMIENQFMYQGRKKLQALARKVGIYYYGFSTATVAKLAAVAGAPTYELKDAYGIAGLHSTTAPYRVTDPFIADATNGDYVAFLNPAGPALRGINTVTAKDASAKTITLAGAIAGAAIDDLVVFANSVENTTLAGTDRDLGLIGVLDIMTSTSVHGVSGVAQPKWNPGYTDTGGGRFTGIKLRKMRQGIENNGGGTLDWILWAQGVENDVLAQLQAGLRFANPFNMEMDGAPKAKGVSLKSTRFVPDGYVFGGAKKSFRKLSLLPKPGTPAWDDADKLQDQSGYIVPIDYPCQMVCLNRGNFGYASGVTMQ